MCLGIPGQIVALDDAAQHLATVDVAGVRRTISVRLLADGPHAGVAPGDWVLVHVGFALATIDQAEAARSLAALRRLDAPDSAAREAPAAAAGDAPAAAVADR